MDLQTFLKDPENKTLLNSYWVHTFFQFIVMSFFYIKGDPTFIFGLYIFTGSTFMILAYVFFQFPITGVLIIVANRLMKRMSEGQGLFFKIILSSGLFIIIASIIAWLCIFLVFSFYNYPVTLGSALRVVMTFVTPVLLPAELFRQRLVMKKVYQ